jgi:hypothetical protein
VRKSAKLSHQQQTEEESDKKAFKTYPQNSKKGSRTPVNFILQRLHLKPGANNNLNTIINTRLINKLLQPTAKKLRTTRIRLFTINTTPATTFHAFLPLSSHANTPLQNSTIAYRMISYKPFAVAKTNTHKNSPNAYTHVWRLLEKTAV